MKQGLIQLQGVDGDDLAIFEFDQEKIEIKTAVNTIENQLEVHREEDNPLDAAEEFLSTIGINRIYITEYANTEVL